MLRLVTIGLLIIVVVQLGIVVRYARYAHNALILLAGIKVHLREAKEEHWQVLTGIRQALLALVEADPRIDHDRLNRLAALGTEFGNGTGDWSYNMPNNYLELWWRDDYIPGPPLNISSESEAQRRNRGQVEARTRLKMEAGLPLTMAVYAKGQT